MNALFVVVLLAVAGVAQANPLEIVHTENLKVGDQTVVVGFTEYPPRAERSLDITFAPKDGIVGKTGSFDLIAPDGKSYDRVYSELLPRHPKNRSVWGLDTIALPSQGVWQLEVTLEGVGKARLPIAVLERPAGPPNTVISLLSLLPVAAIVALAFRAWRRVRPDLQHETHTWS